MSDILIGAAILLLLSGCLFRLAQTASRRVHPWLVKVAAVVVFVGILAFSITIHGSITLTRILPFSNVLIVGNWIPLGSALLMGIVCGQKTIPRWRRGVVCVMLASLAWYTVAHDLLISAPRPARPRFHEGVCVQTTPVSCSPCCAVTLLIHHGIQANEEEMMKLCLTRWDGTPELGLYRGMRLKTRGTQWEVKIIYDDVAMLKEPGVCPALVLVATGAKSNGPGRLCDRPNHAIIVYGISESGVVDVGNPSTGRSRWTIDQLRSRWRHGALLLVPKNDRLTPRTIGYEAHPRRAVPVDSATWFPYSYGATCFQEPQVPVQKTHMTELKPDSHETSIALQQIRLGKPDFDRLFTRHREALRRSVAMRFDAKLRARLDPSDIVQDTQIEALRRLPDYLARQPMPFHLWLRKMAHERLIMMRRRHIDASRRAVGQELPLPDASSALLARQALARQETPSQQVGQAELAQRVRVAIGELPENDREILLMRTYEDLAYDEIACILEIEPTAARKRHGRALIRLHERLKAGGISESKI